MKTRRRAAARPSNAPQGHCGKHVPAAFRISGIFSLRHDLPGFFFGIPAEGFLDRRGGIVEGELQFIARLKTVTDGFPAARAEAVQPDGDVALNDVIEPDVLNRFDSPVDFLAVDSQKLVPQHPLGIHPFATRRIQTSALPKTTGQLIQQIALEGGLLNAWTGLRPQHLSEKRRQNRGQRQRGKTAPET